MSFEQFRRYLADDYVTRTGGRLTQRVQSDYLSRLNRLQQAASGHLEQLPLSSLRSLAETFRSDSKMISNMTQGVQNNLATTLGHYIQFRAGEGTPNSIPANARSIDNDSIIGALLRLGFVQINETQKVSNLRRGEIPVYVKCQSATTPLVIHPGFQWIFSELRSISGVLCDTPLSWYHLSNMRNFPSRRNGGEGLTKYGIAFGFESNQALECLVQVMIREADNDMSDAGVSLRARLREGQTERETLTLARVGQGRFRDDLIALWGGICPISGVARPELLRASHIKPWAASTDDERLDPYNGFLLAVHLDALFDRGLITFDQAGKMLVSERLSEREVVAFGLRNTFQFSCLDQRQFGYLAHHNARFRSVSPG